MIQDSCRTLIKNILSWRFTGVKNTKKRKPISLIIYHHKGGVGKTTIASWLSYLLATGGIAKKDKKLKKSIA